MGTPIPVHPLSGQLDPAEGHNAPSNWPNQAPRRQYREGFKLNLVVDTNLVFAVLPFLSVTLVEFDVLPGVHLYQ